MVVKPLRIVVCEDSPAERGALHAMLEAALACRRIHGEVVCLSSGEEMLVHLADEVFPINFLDIYMNRVTGMEVARAIRARNEQAAVVFTTTSTEHLAEGYTVGALHYLIKPYESEAVDVALDRCLRMVNAGERFIEVTTGGEKRKLLLSHIQYAESQNKSCVITLREESLRVYLRMDELLSMLDDARFLRCHKSFAVNLDCIARMDGPDFVMKNGCAIPVRREDRARMRVLYQNYNFEKIRRGH